MDSDLEAGPGLAFKTKLEYTQLELSAVVVVLLLLLVANLLL